MNNQYSIDEVERQIDIELAAFFEEIDHQSFVAATENVFLVKILDEDSELV